VIKRTGEMDWFTRRIKAWLSCGNTLVDTGWAISLLQQINSLGFTSCHIKGLTILHTTQTMHNCCAQICQLCTQLASSSIRSSQHREGVSNLCKQLVLNRVHKNFLITHHYDLNCELFRLQFSCIK